MRLDFISLAGVAVALVGVGVSIYIFKQQQPIASATLHIENCRDLRSAKAKFEVEAQEKTEDKDELLEKIRFHRRETMQIAKKLENTQHYFNAVKVKTLAEKVWQQYNTGNVPADQNERIRDARGLDRYLGRRYFNVLMDGGLGRTRDQILEELKRVSDYAIAERDRYYSPEFQGLADGMVVVEGLEEAISWEKEQLELALSTLEEVRSEILTADENLSEAAQRLVQAECGA